MSDLNKDDAALQAWHAKFTNDAMVVMKRDMLIQMEEYFDHMFAKAEKKFVLVERASDMVKSLVDEKLTATCSSIQQLQRKHTELEIKLATMPHTEATQCTPLQDCDTANMSQVCEEVCASNFFSHYDADVSERTSLYSVRQLRSKSTTPLPCAPTPAEVEKFLQCGEGRVEHVEQQQANGLGKPCMLVHFRNAESAAAAYTAFRASPYSSQAVLDHKRTHLQNQLVSLAIQLERAAKESGYSNVIFQSRGHLMLVKEGTADAVHYPYIRHMWAGHPPSQGQPFNNVNTSVVGQRLAKILRKPNANPVQSQARPPSQQQQQQQSSFSAPHQADRSQQQQQPSRAPHKSNPRTQQQRQHLFRAPHMASPRTQQQQQQQPPAAAPNPPLFKTPKAVRGSTVHKRQAISGSPIVQQSPTPNQSRSFAKVVRGAAPNQALPGPPPLHQAAMPPPKQTPTGRSPSAQLQLAIASAPAQATESIQTHQAALETEIAHLKAQLAAQQHTNSTARPSNH